MLANFFLKGPKENILVFVSTTQCGYYTTKQAIDNMQMNGHIYISTKIYL